MPPTPRSLADALRTWDDDQLADLLQQRPDLGVPLPHDLGALAGRAASRASTHRAIDGLDTPTLAVLEILALLPEQSSADDVAHLLGRPPGECLDRLRSRALIWGTDGDLRLVRSVRDVLGPYPAGLGPPLAQPAAGELAAGLNDSASVDRLLQDAPDGARTVLDQLAWGPPIGRLADADRPVGPGETASPVRWLIARGLLAVTDAEHVVLPREVALLLRGGRSHHEAGLDPPDLAARPVAGADHGAAGAAAEAVRLVEALGEAWGAAPVSVLRSGGLGVRDLKRLAAALEIEPPVAARLVEIAYAAGLIGDDGEFDPHWAPTPAYDVWRAHGLGRRWVGLAQAWLETTRCPVLVGTRDTKDAPRNALGHDLDRIPAPVIRRWLLATLAGLESGSAPRHSALQARLSWTAPRAVSVLRTTLLDAAVAEAAWLGVTGGGALASFARPLLAADPERSAAALEEALPDPVDHVLLQADLTAVAPGPLEAELARRLELAADAESRGGGAVYRFTPASVRRALDAGRTGDDLIAWLRASSRTPVPQPLEYLVSDTARRHGRIRVGAAEAFVRSDDEATLTELLADRRAASLRLRRLAPTVLAAQASPQIVLEMLRSIGMAPAAESSDGAVVLSRPAIHRTGPRARNRPAAWQHPVPNRAGLLSAAAAMRLTDEAIRAAGRATDGAERPSQSRQTSQTSQTSQAGQTGRTPSDRSGQVDVTTLLTLLRRAATTRTPVWVGYVESDGRPAQRLVEPIEVTGGRVSAFDRQSATVRTFPIARVTAVSPAQVPS